MKSRRLILCSLVVLALASCGAPLPTSSASSSRQDSSSAPSSEATSESLSSDESESVSVSSETSELSSSQEESETISSEQSSEASSESSSQPASTEESSVDPEPEPSSPEASSEEEPTFSSETSSEPEPIVSSSHESSSDPEPIESSSETSREEESSSSQEQSSEATSEQASSEQSSETSSEEPLSLHHLTLDEKNGPIAGSYSEKVLSNTSASLDDGGRFQVDYVMCMASSDSSYKYAQMKRSVGILYSATSLTKIKNFTVTFKASAVPTLEFASDSSFENAYAVSSLTSGKAIALDGDYAYFRIKAASSVCYIKSIDIDYYAGGVAPSSSSSSQTSSEEQESQESSSEATSSSSSSSQATSDAPSDPGTYYDNISKTATGATLKTALFNLIKNHTNNGYDFAYTAYKTSDVDDNGKIIDVYSSCKFDPERDHQGAPGKTNYSKEGDLFNREHTVPQSVFNEAQPMKSDLHHLLPTDGYVNNRRSNYPHAVVSSAKYTSSNGTKVGTSGTEGVSGTVCEPIDEYKGDFARIYFYMVTRYEDKVSGWKSFGAFSGNSFPALSSWAISLYLKWSEQDPVSEKEVKRNEVIYGFQKNRNPFVDHPEYAKRIWG